jgi:hypothetical protein
MNANLSRTVYAEPVIFEKSTQEQFKDFEKNMNANLSRTAYAEPVIFEKSTQEQFKDFEKSFPAGSNALQLKTSPAIFEPHIQEVIEQYYKAMKKIDT